MSPLSPEQIAAIYKKKEEEAAKPKKRGGGGRKKAVDFNDRSYQAWFALEHTNPGDEFCDNPDCFDPRGNKYASPPESAEQVVAEVGTVKMCRYCFIVGWLTERADSGQEQLAV